MYKESVIITWMDGWKKQPMKSRNANYYISIYLASQIQENYKVLFKIKSISSMGLVWFGLMLQTLGTLVLDLVTNQINFALTKILLFPITFETPS